MLLRLLRLRIPSALLCACGGQQDVPEKAGMGAGVRGGRTRAADSTPDPFICPPEDRPGRLIPYMRPTAGAVVLQREVSNESFGSASGFGTGVCYEQSLPCHFSSLL